MSLKVGHNITHVSVIWVLFLSQDMMFYLIPEVKPSRSVLTEMIESAGGKVIKTLPPYSSVARFVNIRVIRCYIKAH